MNMSDVWRGTRHSDKAREIALVTRGVSDFCGTAAEDRAIRVSWDLTSGYGRSDSSRKIVELNGGLLNDIQAPFDGAFVDQLMGLSAHEAGHLMIAEVLGHKNSRGYRDELGAQVSNVVEDLAIDGRPMAVHNRTLGELTANVRIGPLRDAQREGMRAMWDSGNPLSAEGLLNLWGCARLFQSRDILKSTPQRAVLMATIAALDSEADKIQNSDKPLLITALLMPKAVEAIRTILGGMPAPYEQPAKGPGKGKPEKGEGKAEGHATGGSPEKGDSGSGSSEEPEEEEAPEEPKGSEGDDSPGENDGGEAEESDGDGGESGGEADGAGGDGAGKASNVYKPTKPMTCVNDAAKMAPTKAEKELFEAVAEELYALDLIDQLRNADRNADRVLAPYLDKRIVADVLRAYSEIASEPMRRKREEAGKLDRHRLPFAGKRADVFTTQQDKVLDGTLVLLLDMSGSTTNVQTLIKQAGASVCAALRKTAIKPYVFTYGDTVVQLASPERVVDFDTVQSDGGTPTNIAFNKVLDTVKPEGQSVIIHVTDGTPDQPVFAGQAMAKAQAAGWRIINVLVGNFGTGATEQYDQFNGGIYDPRSYGAPGFRRLNTYKELPKLIQAAVKAIVKGGKAC